MDTRTCGWDHACFGLGGVGSCSVNTKVQLPSAPYYELIPSHHVSIYRTLVLCQLLSQMHPHSRHCTAIFAPLVRPICCPMRFCDGARHPSARGPQRRVQPREKDGCFCGSCVVRSYGRWARKRGETTAFLFSRRDSKRRSKRVGLCGRLRR